MYFKLEQIDSGSQLAYKVNTVDDEDYLIEKDGWDFVMKKNGTPTMSLRYDLFDLVIDKKKNSGYYKVYVDYGEYVDPIGFIDDMGDNDKRFALSIDDRYILCKEAGGKFYIVTESQVAGVIEKVRGEYDTYNVYLRDEQVSEIAMLICMYIDIKWYCEEKGEALKSIVDKGLHENTKHFKISLLDRIRISKEFEKDEEIFNRCKNMASI